MEGFDHQQALVLGALRRAAGAPVSYGELRRAGVELPASVVSELELAGLAVQRCLGHGRGVVGVRLDPADDPAARPTPDPAEQPAPIDTDSEPAWSSVRIYRASSLEGHLHRIPGPLPWSTGKGNELERDRATGKGRQTLFARRRSDTDHCGSIPGVAFLPSRRS